MIAAVCANPCVDRTVTIDKFTYGGMNRIRHIHDDGSGKGVNVALACAQLGLGSACLGFMPKQRNETILHRLQEGGSSADFIEYPGAVRVNTKILDASTGIITELNESGPAVSENDVQQLIAKALFWASRCSFLVLTGSIPPGCPQGLYATIIREIRAAAPLCRIVLDAEGEKLAEGIAAAPFMVKPNRYELELLCGKELPTVREIHAESQRLISAGVALVAVSLGAGGAYVTDGCQAYCAPALAVQVRSTVGAGDSFVAGMLYAMEANLPLYDVFRYGMAAAASSVTTVGTGLVDRALFHALLPDVDIRRVA